MRRSFCALICFAAIYILCACNAPSEEIATYTERPSHYSDAFLQYQSARLRSAASYSFKGVMVVSEGGEFAVYDVTFGVLGGERAMVRKAQNGVVTRYVWSKGEKVTLNDQLEKVTSVADSDECLYDLEVWFKSSNVLRKDSEKYNGTTVDMYELIVNGNISKHLFDSSGELVQSKYYSDNITISIDYIDIMLGEVDNNIFVIPEDYERSVNEVDDFVPSEKAAVELPNFFPSDVLPLCTGARLQSIEEQVIFERMQLTVVYDTWLDFSSVDKFYANMLYDSDSYERAESQEEDRVIVRMTGSVRGWKITMINIEKLHVDERTKIKIIITQN